MMQIGNDVVVMKAIECDKSKVKSDEIRGISRNLQKLLNAKIPEDMTGHDAARGTFVAAGERHMPSSRVHSICHHIVRESA